MGKTTNTTWTVTDTTVTTEAAPKDKGKEFRTSLCQCGLFRADNLATHCAGTTGAQFRQGHDAKLKGLLIEAGTRELPLIEVYFVGTGQTTVTTTTLMNDQGRERTRIERSPQVREMTRPVDPQTVANRYRFGHMVEAGIARATQRSAKKATAKPIRVKVGRWVYEVTGTNEDGRMTYLTKSGETKLVPANAAVVQA